jgi:hypothetical protein
MGEAPQFLFLLMPVLLGDPAIWFRTQTRLRKRLLYAGLANFGNTLA